MRSIQRFVIITYNASHIRFLVRLIQNCCLNFLSPCNSVITTHRSIPRAPEPPPQDPFLYSTPVLKEIKIKDACKERMLLTRGSMKKKNNRGS